MFGGRIANFHDTMQSLEDGFAKQNLGQLHTETVFFLTWNAAVALCWHSVCFRDQPMLAYHGILNDIINPILGSTDTSGDGPLGAPGEVFRSSRCSHPVPGADARHVISDLGLYGAASACRADFRQLHQPGFTRIAQRCPPRAAAQLGTGPLPEKTKLSWAACQRRFPTGC